VSELYVAGRLKEIDPVIFEGLCIHELFLRMGFPEEAMSIESAVTKVIPENTLFPERCSGRDERCLRVRLSWRGRLWVGAIGPCAFDGDELNHHWRKGLEAFNGATEADAAPFWEASRARRKSDGIKRALRAKGITPPVLS
jgi:hypothetical protein